MNPRKVIRENIRKLTALPNIGKAGAADLELLGIDKSGDLVGQDPYVIDVFISGKVNYLNKVTVKL